MASTPSTSQEKGIYDNLLANTPDFSLVLGGPLFQFFRKAHLEGDHFELLYRRIIVITAIAWLPVALLAAASPLRVAPVGLRFFAT